MTRSWWDNEDIIRQFRDWLTQTADEIDALDALDADGHPAEAGECPVEEWGTTFNSGTGNDSRPQAQQVGLLSLVEAFTAMRHELKLQTKGTRNLESTVERSLAGLDDASRAMKSVQAADEESAARVALPLVEALIELDEGLRRAGTAFQAAHRHLTESAPARLLENLDKQFEMQSWWRRLMTRRWHRQMRKVACGELNRWTANDFAGLMQGFELLQVRMERTLQEHAIRRMDETRIPVDPNRMSVVELVDDDVAPPETVLDVVRPGYLWGERVVRFAEVRAVARRAWPVDAWHEAENSRGRPGEVSQRPDSVAESGE